MERFKYGKEGTFVPLNPKDPLNRGVNQKSDKVVTMIVPTNEELAIARETLRLVK